jgi:hypothetical protein
MMVKRCLLACAWVAAAAFVILAPRTASAAPNDAAALKLRDQAIDTDYLATNFTAAEEKLQKALALCKTPAECSHSVHARLLCDLGVIYFMLQKADEGRAQFAAALKEDAQLTLDPDLSTTDLQREFAAVKSGHPATPAPSSAPAASGPGDMAHTPVKSQTLRTPIPIYVELPEGVSPKKVFVRYSPPGSSDWKTITMTKLGQGYSAEIPCTEVGNTPGELKYFVAAADPSGDVLATSGRLTQPYHVAIVEHLEGDAPRLPGRPPPTACAAGSSPAVAANADAETESTDCPPGFPGCHSDSTSCTSNDDCAEGQACSSGSCAEMPETDRPHAPFKKNWISIAFQTDALLMPSANNACAGGTGYTCFGSNGSYYADPPLANADDVVNGGLTLATSRVLLGFDRAFGENVTLGVRVGYALAGGPQRTAAGPERPAGASFLPVHAEARVAYWLGKNVLARQGFRFFLLGASGMAQVDASVPVDIYADATAYNNRQSQNFRAWKKTGLAFAALGGGTMFALTPSTGILLEVKAVEMLPKPATGFNLQLGYVVGL